MKKHINQNKARHSLPLIALFLGALGFLSGCSTQHTRSASPELEAEAKWLLLPVVNYSQTPLAGERAEAILETRLHAESVYDIALYPIDNDDDALDAFDDSKRLVRAMKWSRKQGADYLITGSVDEWRYKSGLDGEPAVGISLKVLKLPEEKVVWSGSAARSGWPKESLAGTAQIVITELLDDVDW